MFIENKEFLKFGVGGCIPIAAGLVRRWFAKTIYRDDRFLAESIDVSELSTDLLVCIPCEKQ